MAATASPAPLPKWVLGGILALLLLLLFGSKVAGWLMPVEPLPASEVGDTCTGSFQCRGEYGICLRDSSDAAGHCTRACREDSVCPGDMTCSVLFVESGSTVRVCGH